MNKSKYSDLFPDFNQFARLIISPIKVKRHESGDCGHILSYATNLCPIGIK